MGVLKMPYPVADPPEIYYVFGCPTCHEKNWWYSGRADRMINPTDWIVSLRCWNCEQIFLMRELDDCVDCVETADEPDDGIRMIKEKDA